MMRVDLLLEVLKAAHMLRDDFSSIMQQPCETSGL